METGPSRGNSRGERPRRGGMVKCRGWRLTKALFEELYFIQRAQKSHRKYWDGSTIRCHVEERLGARGVKAGDLHADSPPSVFPPPQVGTAPYVPIRKGGGTSPLLLPSSSTEPDSTEQDLLESASVGGRAEMAWRRTTQSHLPFQSWKGRGLEASCLGEAPVRRATPCHLAQQHSCPLNG